MPKRPCAVVLTPDQSTILCADKFGDVYAMPLLGQNKNVEASGALVAEETNKFVPSANSSTVHTKRNLESLRQQQKEIKKKVQKKALVFEHQIVLGHVSLLTDLACAPLLSPKGSLRYYVITSDRDEHIRISRGLPQAHIIEGYCLGHSQFISKLCLIPSKPRLLLSGGGDGDLVSWDWPSGTIRQRIDIGIQAEKLRQTSSNTQNDPLQTIVASSETRSSVAINNIEYIEAYTEQDAMFSGEVFLSVEG